MMPMSYNKTFPYVDFMGDVWVNEQQYLYESIGAPFWFILWIFPRFMYGGASKKEANIYYSSKLAEKIKRFC